MPYLGRLPLGPLTTFGLAASADQAWQLDSLAELDDLHRFLAATPRPPLLMGGGSNLLLARDLVEPVVLIRTRGRDRLDDDGRTALVEIAAGENWDGVVRWSLDEGLAGLENLILIPGTAGAAPIQNIGAYGVELASVIDSVRAWHWRENRFETFSRDACRFGYRDSLFKQPGQDGWLIVSLRLRLRRGGPVHLDYGEIRAELAAAGRRRGTAAPTAPPSAPEVAAAVERIRRRKLPDPAVLGNAGSFFKNPVVAAATADRVAAIALAEGLGQPASYPAGDSVKLSAAWLIDRCGWKGHRDGDAGVSPGHALVLVNYGRASGAGMLALARGIQASVEARFGLRLEPEPRIIA